MFDYNFHNKPTCAFAEQAVSILYGEADAQEKTIFEAHLQSCSCCAEEFAGFREAHSSVVEWRNLEFAALELPTIETSYQDTANLVESDTTSRISYSWNAQLRRFFSPLSTAAAFAIVLVCFGAAFFAVKYTNKQEVAGIGVKISISSQSVPVENNETASNAANDTAKETVVSNLPSASTKPAKSNIENTYREVDDNSRVERKDTLTNVAETPNKPTKNSVPATAFRRHKATNGENVQTRYAQAKNLPKLNALEDEEDDKSLRLAELFDGDSR